MSNYTALDLKTLEDIEASRLRPSMYIPNREQAGMSHLMQEIVSNSVDECLNHSGDTVIIEIDTKRNRAQIRDYGRGIPIGTMKSGANAMIEIATKNHSGGKFGGQGEGGYNVSGGLHGIGLTATNALSSMMTIESFRDGKSAIAKFARGLVIDYTEGKQGTNKRGTLITFIPDTEIFHKNIFKYSDVKEKILMMSYLNSDIKFELTFDGKKEIIHSPQGIKQLIHNKIVDPVTGVVYIHQDMGNGFKVEVAIQYSSTMGEKIYAFTNSIPNPDGGEHVTGLKSSLTTAFNRLAKVHGLMEADDVNLKGDALRKGMTAVVSFFMSETPDFEGQTKQKLLSKIGRTMVSKAITGNIDSTITKKDLTTIVETALLERKAEAAAKKAREAANSVKRGGARMKRMDLPVKLVDCQDHTDAELFIVEGNSAGGSAKDGRDNKTQAILALRGKVLNTHDKELDEIIKNKEINAILTTLGCGIGEHYLERNLRYKRVILMADADPDGKLLPVAFFH
jgi:DNA gyrase/topoisomerase IV subunit B